VIQSLEDQTFRVRIPNPTRCPGFYPCKSADIMDVTMPQQNNSANKVILKEWKNKSSFFYSQSYSCKNVKVIRHDKNLASRMPKEDWRDHSYHVLFMQDRIIAGIVIVQMRQRFHELFRIWPFIYGRPN
jgi:hypothetical protein